MTENNATFTDIINMLELEDNFNILVSSIGTVGEAGEYANLIKKMFRDGQEIKEEVKEELADIIIYCILNAKYFDIDIEKAIIDKIRKNEKRRGNKNFEYRIRKEEKN